MEKSNSVCLIDIDYLSDIWERNFNARFKLMTVIVIGQTLTIFRVGWTLTWELCFSIRHESQVGCQRRSYKVFYWISFSCVLQLSSHLQVTIIITRQFYKTVCVDKNHLGSARISKVRFPFQPYHSETCHLSLFREHSGRTNDMKTIEYATFCYDTVVENGLNLLKISIFPGRTTMFAVHLCTWTVMMMSVNTSLTSIQKNQNLYLPRNLPQLKSLLSKEEVLKHLFVFSQRELSLYGEEYHCLVLHQKTDQGWR